MRTIKKEAKNKQWGSITLVDETLPVVDRVFLLTSLVAVMSLVFPHPALASSIEREAPLVFEIENPTYLAIKFQNLPLAESIPEEIRLWKNHPEDNRVQILEDYLISRNAPIAPYASTLLKNEHYRLILGISFAESNFCKHQIKPYNCWGIGGGRPETYADYDAAFTRANDLIQKYHDRGMTTPKLMRNSWVGWQNESWIRAVNQILADLDEIGL
jgi:hypothetical protein